MKNLFTIILICLFGANANAQSEVQFTHYMLNKLSYNPGYAGAKGSFDLLGIYRKQWSGIEGAPSTAAFNFHAPLGEGRNAIGAGLTNDRIGKVATNALDLFYAYRVKFSNKTKLSLGLQGRLEHANLKWTLADPLDIVDFSIPNTNESAFAPNFGLGAYYYGEDFFVGLSVPRLLKNALFLDRSEGVVKEAFLTYYFNTGAAFELSPQVTAMPSILVTYNSNAPMDVDLNANFVILDNIIAGLSYRMDDSVDGLIGFQFSNGMRIGMAMDFTTSELQKFTNGSFEIMLGYTFQCPNCNVNHLRYF